MGGCYRRMRVQHVDMDSTVLDALVEASTLAAHLSNQDNCQCLPPRRLTVTFMVA